MLFCEFSPAFRQEYRVIDFEKNRVNKFSEHREYPTGELVDVLISMHELLGDSKLLTYTGGKSGEEFREKLNEIGVKTILVSTKDETLEEVVVRSRTLKTVILGENPVLTTDEEESLLSRASEEIHKDQVVIVSNGDRVDRALYKNFFNLCRKHGARIFIAPSRIEEIAHLMLVEKEMLENHTKFIIETQNQVMQAANILFAQGIEILVVSSQSSIMAMTSEESYRIETKDVNKKFDKIKFLTGAALGTERGYDFETTLKLGVACAYSDSKREFDMAEVKSFMKELQINRVRNKI